MYFFLYFFIQYEEKFARTNFLLYLCAKFSTIGKI